MRRLVIDGMSGTSTILVNERRQNINNYLPETKLLMITDQQVASLYPRFFEDAEVVELGQGEASKTLNTVEMIYRRMLDAEIDRHSFVLAVGGGIVCDVAGFAASTFMRGIPFGFVASTLLAQVDASVGGKNGVNFDGYKNMVGVFHQPSFVLCDLDMLKTLPRKEVLVGFAEIVKHALIKDAALFTYIEANVDQAIKLEPVVLEKLIYDSLLIKSSVVNRDEQERGERRILNFGHTMAHALEKTSHFSHGEAVSMGMVMACSLSVKLGLLKIREAEKITTLLQKLDLPVAADVSKQALKEAIRRDKKRIGDSIHFVLLKGIGQAVISEISISELEEVIDDLC